MAARPRALAKLTRPKVYDAVQRPRLFALLDEAMERPIVWVSAPPGAGKSTLASSWLAARSLEHLWYQVDVGDGDPSTFIHYLRQAALQRVGKPAASLPLFGAEAQQNVARFARGFFRDLFSLLPRPCVVVLDNFHEAAPQPDHRAALAQGLEEIPDGINVLVLSRSDPPAEFARLTASRRIARIEPSALRCTAEEGDAILGSQHQKSGELARVLAGSDGWVAALVLLREHLSKSGSSLDRSLEESLHEGKDAIFQYFAGEIFNGARPENQRVLMLTAIPPSFTATEAVALSGVDEAPRLLEYLFRRHLFIDRRRGAETTYQYHALFREFLLDALNSRVLRAERRDATFRAAGLLAARGQIGEALALYRDAEAWPEMTALIHAHALEWARQGRAQALSDWIDALPAALRGSDPWLDYWYGRAWIFIRPERGRPALEAAFEAFRAANDLRGQVLALGTIVTGYYYEWANFSPLDRWLSEFDRLLTDPRAASLDRESQLRLHAARVIALLFRRPGDPGLAESAARLDDLLSTDCNVNVRMMAASTLFNYINWATDGESATSLVARIAPVVAEPEVTPLMQVWWRTHLSFWHYVNGRYADAASAAAAARDIANRFGLEAHLFEIDHADASALINKGDLAAAATLLDAIERQLSPSRRMDWAYYHMLRSSLEQRLGRPAAAVQAAEKAVALGRATGLPQLQMPHFLARLAQARQAAGEREAAFAAFDEAIATATPIDRASFGRQRTLAQIGFDIDDGNLDAASRSLAAELAAMRERGQTAFLRNRPDVAARLANFALMRGIETEFVQALIAHNELSPPADAVATWPFRLRIRALGGFELVRDGQPLRFTGKAQQRPLDLLKLLVALGGRDVDTQRVTSALWPDADGAAARTSFDTTLFRLRKLLDVERALVVAGGKLTLDRSVAWTDIGALEAAFAAADAAASAADADAARAATNLLAAWRGPLLGAEEHPWVVEPREALRARLVRMLHRLGEALERRQQWAAAVDVYRRGVEADNLAEPLYRGLMRALNATGDRAEAINAFRRCRELLSIVLSVKPSAETERLYRQIAAATH